MASESVLPEVLWRFTAGGVADDLWVVTHVHLREAMSSLFSCTVVLATEDDVAAETFLGTTAKLDVLRGGGRRSLQGVVRRVQVLGALASHRFVLMEVVPSLWLLSQRSDVRIFQDMNAVRVVEEVLRRAESYKGDRLAIDPALRSLPAREYCVQYNETDLDFVRRLLEHEGVPFYFRHDGEDGETLVLAGPEHAYAPVATLDGAALRVLDEGSATHAVETVRWFDERHEVRTTGVTLRDFDFTRPRATLDMTSHSPADAGSLARYEYPAPATLHGYDRGARRFTAHDAPRLAKVRAEELATRAHLGEGSGNVTGVAPGLTFDLAGHARGELDRAYLVAEAVHVGQAWSVLPENLRESKRVRAMLIDAGLTAPDGFDDRYENRFITHRLKQAASSVPFRPARATPRPVVEGPQTARVVGPAGEDIHTDEHGRIKVQLHWDREGREDEKSSCWIRCAQGWSGGQWGFVFIPRIGMEVVVQFLEGDPDRPLVTGCVYNGENHPPYNLPEHKTRSTIKTLSTPATGGYNEIRFEDAAGREQMYVQAERDQDTLVKHDRTLTVGRHSTRDIGGDERITVHQNRATQIVEHDTFTVDGNQETEVHGASGQSVTVDANETIQVGKVLAVTVGKQVVVNCGASTFTMDAMGNISLSGTNVSISSVGPVTVNGEVIELN
ncbi:MAG: type VI secretion system tip protein TssI/VgrG [Polyangiales bacterium]